VDERLGKAVEENVAWCDRVCRAAGVTTFLDPERWWAASRTPPLYPDAITRRSGVAPVDLLAGVDDGRGCSVKDSFADLDLSPLGFEILFEAQWVHRAPSEPSATPWWEEDQWWDLPDDPTVVQLRADDGSTAVLHQADGVVGVSNADPVDRTWQAAIAREWGQELVGYERGPGLEVALRNGFVAVGPVRIWVRPG
jgi:hypothetical protein